jgi:hypothetical protein
MYKLVWEEESGGAAGGSWSGDVLKIKDGYEVVAELHCNEAQGRLIVGFMNDNYEAIQALVEED